MKIFEKVIFGLIISTILLYGIFMITFTLGMIDTNRAKQIDADIVSECVTDMQNSNKALKLKNLELYYQQGKIHANIYFDNNLSLDESKIVVKSLKDFILKDKINNYLSKKHSSQLNIRVTIYSKDNSYYYQCPYYIESINNWPVKSNYKTWYLTESSGETIETMNID